MSQSSQASLDPEETRAPPRADPVRPLWPSPLRRRWLVIVLAVGWTIALQVPVAVLQNLPTGVRALFPYSKGLHVVVYAALAAVSGWLLLPRRYRWLLALVLVGHALGTEWLQYALEDLCGRTGQWSDVGLNLLGLALGMGLSLKWWLARESG